MLSLLNRLFSRHEKSSETARQRLRLVLVLDRIGLASEQLTAMKDEMIQVVSHYLVVDEKAMDLEIRRDLNSVTLVSNIPVKELLRSGALSS